MKGLGIVKNMKRLTTAMLAALLTLGAASAAYAHDRDGGSGHEKAVFPMKADEFQKRLDGRLAKARERMEHHLIEKQVPADKAKEIRARFDAGVAQVNTAAKQATADGVVTADEAKQVREVARALHPNKHHRGDSAPAQR